ncbi:hypothetical protein Tco_0169130 [Tanacetum coccineum]
MSVPTTGARVSTHPGAPTPARPLGARGRSMGVRGELGGKVGVRLGGVSLPRVPGLGLAAARPKTQTPPRAGRREVGDERSKNPPVWALSLSPRAGRVRKECRRSNHRLATCAKLKATPRRSRVARALPHLPRARVTMLASTGPGGGRRCWVGNCAARATGIAWMHAGTLGISVPIVRALRALIGLESPLPMWAGARFLNAGRGTIPPGGIVVRPGRESQDKYVTEILNKFGFTDVKTASTPMETQKPLLKDEDGEEVDVYLYRSMIGSLMYLTSSRPDIMFAVCACARYQVNPKVSHLHAMKRIFRYLKGQPKLGLWYPKDLPFDLVAYTDSDYAGASLDRKSTTGVVFLTKSAESEGFEQILDFLNASSIKYALTVNPTIYTSCIEQFWSTIKAKTINEEVQLQALVDGKKIVVTEASVKRDLQLEDADGVDCLPNSTIFE